MAFIQDITVNISYGAFALARKGFGLPLILGDSHGSQLWLFSNSTDTTSPSGLTADTDYTATITVDGHDQNITVTGADGQTIDDVITLINTGLADIAIASFIPGGNGGIKIESTTTGIGSSISIQDTDLFSSLPGIKPSPEDPIPGCETGVYKEYSDLSSVEADYNTNKPEYKMARAMFSQTPGPKKVVIYIRATGESITQALDQLKENHNGFYAIFITERGPAEMAEAGDWANLHQKFFFGCTDYCSFDRDINRDCDREAYLIHNRPLDYPECAWAGQNLPKDPGSITWKWKTLSSQMASDYSITELDNIRTKKCQAITEIGGVPVVNEGKTTSGKYIDVIRGMDWVKARIEEGLYNLFISNDKIAMDNVGIAKVEGVVRTVLKQAGNLGIIARATTESEMSKSDDKEFMYKVTVPRREDIDPVDRKTRKLPNVEFVYYLAGAIHEAEVKGKITV